MICFTCVPPVIPPFIENAIEILDVVIIKFGTKLRIVNPKLIQTFRELIMLSINKLLTYSFPLLQKLNVRTNNVNY